MIFIPHPTSTKATRVLVFKTNISSVKDIRQLTSLLDSNPGILRWNVDQHDIDNVLRIETKHLFPQDIIRVVSLQGFACEELPD